MAERRSLRSLWYVRDFPPDLTAVIAVTVLVNVAVFAPVIRETPIRVPLGIFFVLFVPGYALVAALFPETEESPVSTAADGTGVQETEKDQGRNLIESVGIDGPVRIVLSLGLGVAVVPLIGLVLTVASRDLSLLSVTVALSGFTVLMTGIAAVRRWQLPESDRFRLPYREWLATVRSSVFKSDSQVDTVLSILLVTAILLAVGSVAFAVTHTSQGESFSEMYLLTEDDNDELVADGYPTEFELGESEDVVLGVENREHQTLSYSAVVVEQDVRTDDNTTIVQEQQELDRFETQLAHNETWLHEHELEPTMTGDEVRIVWLLYVDGEVPSSPSTENADYHVHLWVSVEDINSDG